MGWLQLSLAVLSTNPGFQSFRQLLPALLVGRPAGRCASAKLNLCKLQLRTLFARLELAVDPLCLQLAFANLAGADLESCLLPEGFSRRPRAADLETKLLRVPRTRTDTNLLRLVRDL